MVVVLISFEGTSPILISIRNHSSKNCLLWFEQQSTLTLFLFCVDTIFFKHPQFFVTWDEYAMITWWRDDIWYFNHILHFTHSFYSLQLFLNSDESINILPQHFSMMWHQTFSLFFFWKWQKNKYSMLLRCKYFLTIPRTSFHQFFVVVDKHQIWFCIWLLFFFVL